MSQIISFIINNLKEINPSKNFKSLHTNIRGDVLAGITVAIIALPMALAFGEMSGLGPIAGVWGAIAGGVVGGLFGGCMVGVSGPTAPKAAQISLYIGAGAIISTVPELDKSAAFSIIFLSGLILAIISMLKISHFIHYTPYPVVAGFMCGIGVIVIFTQMNAFLGLPPEEDIHAVFKNFGSIVRDFNPQALYVSIPSLLILFLWSPIGKRIEFLKKIPSPLIALIAGTSISYYMNKVHSIKLFTIRDDMKDVSGDIFSFYIPNLNQFGDFIGPAFALAGLAVLDSLLSCKVADNMTGTRHSSDRETFGQGMANMAAGLIGGVTTATATMRTVANIKFGGKTPLASIVHGLTLLSILLGLGVLVAIIPKACLAAILFKVGIDIMDYRILPVLRKLPITDLLIFIIVLFVTVYADLLIAVGIGVAFAFLRYIKDLKLNYDHQVISLLETDFITEKNNLKEVDKSAIRVLEPRGPLFFASIEHLVKVYSDTPKHEMLIIDMGRTTMIDLSGVYALEDLIKNVRSKNIKVFVSNANSKIKQVLERMDFMKHLGRDYYQDSKESMASIISKHYITQR